MKLGRKKKTEAASVAPRVREKQAIALLSFLTADFAIGAAYFLYGYIAFRNSEAIAELVHLATDNTNYSISVDTSEYLWWALPFLAVTAVLGGWLFVRVRRYRQKTARLLAKQRVFLPKKERAADAANTQAPIADGDFAAEANEKRFAAGRATASASRRRASSAVSTRIRVVDAEEIRESVLGESPAWLTDPLTVVRTPEGVCGMPLVDMRPRGQREQPDKRKNRRTEEIPYGGELAYVPRQGKKASPYAEET